MYLRGFGSGAYGVAQLAAIRGGVLYRGRSRPGWSSRRKGLSGPVNFGKGTCGGERHERVASIGGKWSGNTSLAPQMHHCRHRLTDAFGRLIFFRIWTCWPAALTQLDWSRGVAHWRLMMWDAYRCVRACVVCVWVMHCSHSLLTLSLTPIHIRTHTQGHAANGTETSRPGP